MSHKISIEGNTLRFAAAHFATIGDTLEPLHGHNYRVTAEISGPLTSDAWVIDFGDAKAIVRAICKDLDHRLILQIASGDLQISDDGQETTVCHGNKRYVIPSSDVVRLDIDNTTAERLAEWIAGRLCRELEARGTTPDAISVGVEEMPGQSGWYSSSVDTQ